MTSYGDIDLGQHMLRWWFFAWHHQFNIWTNVDLPSLWSSDIHLRAYSQEVPPWSITKISLEKRLWALKMCLAFILHNTVSQLSLKSPRRTMISENNTVHKQICYYSEKARACVQNGITQQGRLADEDMKTSPSGRVVMSPYANPRVV